MTKKNEIIPYFIQIRGCINCDTSKSHKRRTGYDYGFHHEDVIACVLKGCQDNGFFLAKPFIDPEEVFRLTKRENNPEIIKKAKDYCLRIKDRFGRYYKM